MRLSLSASILALATLLATAALALAGQPSQAGQPSGGPALGAALQRGGYVIFLRHAQDDGVDQSPVDVNDCQTQSYLTDEGRAQARAVGQQFRAMGIPVGRVMSSQFCRAHDTAVLAFGDTETLEILTLPGALSPALREEQPAAIVRLLSTPPPAGTNTVLVGHGGVLLPITGVNVERAEAAIFSPGGEAGYRLVTILTWDEWSSLAPSK